MKIFNKIVCFILISSWGFTAVTVTGTKSGSRDVSGYFNETNGITITVTLSGDDASGGASDKSNDFIYVELGFSSSSSVSSYPVDMSTLTNNPVSPLRALSDNTVDINITASSITEADGWAQDKYFDMQIFFSDSASVKYAVDFDGGASASIRYETTNPWLNTYSYPGTNFNTQQVIYQPDEDLSSTYTSTITFTGTAGDDDGTSHVYNLGTQNLNELQTGSNITLDLSGLNEMTNGYLVDGSTYNLTFAFYDVAGNYNSGTYTDRNYDTSVPTISSISTSTNDGTFGIGDQISFTINFSEDVTASGTVNVTFETGTPDEVVTITSGNISSTNSVTSTYTVTVGDSAPDLTINTIAMASGALKDDANNAMTDLSIPAGQNLDDAANFEVDGIRPTISSFSSSSSNGSYSVGDDINITVTFSEAVTATGDITITLETGTTDRTVTISNISSSLTAIGTYTVQTGDETSDLAVLSLSGTLADAAGNSMTDASIPAGQNISDNYDIAVETTAPVIGSITSSASASTYGIGASIPITVNFINGAAGAAENVTLSSGSFDLTLDTGDEVSNASISNSSSASFTYSVSEGDASSDLDVSSAAISGGGSITDAAGNALSDFSIIAGSNLADNEAIVIEATRPTITAVTSTTNDDTYKAGDDINITIQFSESVTLSTSTLDLTFDFEGADQTINIPIFTNSNSTTYTYTIQEGDTTADLSINNIELASGATLRDVVPNSPNDMTNFTPATTLASAHAIAIDGILPTITKVTSTSSDGSYSIGESVNVTVYFYEPVTLSGGNLVITLETGSPDQTVSISSITTATSASGSFTVVANDVSSDLAVNTIAISGGGSLSDAAGNVMTDFSIPANKNISDFKDIIIDGSAPADFTTGDITTVASNNTFIISRYWNEMNTDVDVTVPIASDNSLVGGTVQVLAKIGGNGYVDVGAVETIQTTDVSAGTMDIRIDKSGSINTDIEELTSFANGGVITFNAIITDLAGNSKTGTPSDTTLTIDTTAATITDVTSSTNDGIYNTGDDIIVDMTFSDAVTLTGGTLDVTMESGSTDNFVSISSISGSSTVSTTYTVQSGDSNADLYVKTLAVSGGYLIDVAGNPMSTADLTISTGNNISDSKNIEIDGIDPSDFTVGSLTATGGTVYSGYWNSTNTGLDIVIPIDNDASLTDGTVQIRGKVNSESYENLGSAETIAVGELDGNKTISITFNQLEGLQSFPIEGSTLEAVVTITAIITDEAGNSVTGTESATTLSVDQTVPSSFTADTVYSNGGVGIANYYNGVNTGITVRIPLESGDLSLTGGKIRLQAKAGSNNSWTNVAGYNTVVGGDYSEGFKDVSVDSGGTDSTDLHELTGFTENENLYFQAVLWDIAGNQRTSSQSTTNMFIDQTQPTITSVSSSTANGSYKSGDTINVDVTASEIINITGTPQLQLETGNADATVNYSSGSTTNKFTFIYVIDDGHSSSDLDVANINALSLNNGTILDNAGNSLVLTLPTPGGSGSLSNNKAIVIDTEVPTAVITYSDSLVKENDEVTVTVTFSEEMTASPRIAIDYTGVGADLDTTNMSNVNDTVWTKIITIPDGNDGAAVVSIISEDLAGNSLTNLNTTNRSLMRVDNTHPTFTLLSPDSGEYVNHALVGYKLSETSFAGTITWTKVGGSSDSNSPHTSALSAIELDATTTFSDYTLTNVPANLVSGTTYKITWSATDSAGNISEDFISTPVYYDTTAPTVALTYNRYIASVDTLVTITAQFNERVLPTPQITIDYTGSGNDVSGVNMTIGTDSTIWTYGATIPAGNNGIASISITTTDLATNALRAADVANSDTLLIDNTLPTAVITYSDSLVKENDQVTVTVTFSEEMIINPNVKISVDYTGAGDDIDATAMTYVNDTVWTKIITIPDGNDGAAVVSIIAEDLAGNSLTNANTTNRSLMRVDNTHPTFTLLSPDSGEYVNQTLIGYKLSETSLSGFIRWARIDGLPDIDHTVTLSTAELDAGTTFSDYSLTNMPTNLVSGSIYRITWSATDSAGNVSEDFVSTPVHYDTTAPTVDLTYSKYIVSADTVVTITAQFDESVVDPQIEITYGVDNVSATTMTIGSDSTVWTYVDTIPSGIGNEDTATVLITTVDLATNALRSSDISNSDTLFVDNTEPTITFSYENLTQTHLTNEGKYQDVIEITAQFSEKANTVTPPKLNIEYSDSTNDSFINRSAFSFSNNDSVWIYRVTLPDSSNNDGLFTASLTAKDIAGNPVSTFNNNLAFTVDNTPPADFSTGAVTPQGQNQVTGWYNSMTDSIEILAPVPFPADDNTILGGGSMDVQAFNIVRGAAWVTIDTQDSLTGSGSSISFYRTKSEIESVLDPSSGLLVQGDTLIFRAAVTDRVGNITYGDTSVSKLVYDPFAPTLGAVTGGIFFTKDTVVSSDSLSAVWSTFTDSVSNSNPGSGLSFYEYKIQFYDANGVFVDTLKGWTPIGTSETVTHTDLALTHDNLYSFHVRATDVAGNVSEIMNSDTIRRINSAPIITAITDTIQSYEDVPFSQTIEFTDADTATLMGDNFTYNLTSTHQYAHVPSTPAVFLTGTNVINWTPTQSDTGLYTFQVIIQDNWTFADTISYSFFVNAVNDTPTVAIITPYDNQTMLEDQTAISKFLLSVYGEDVDNDSTQLTWQAAVLDTSGKPGFPTSAALFFGNGTPEVVKQRLIDQYQPQQKNKVIKPLKETKGKSSEIRSVNSPNVRYKNSLANYIQVALTDTNGVWWAEFQVDSNYYGANHHVVFYVSDPDGATAQDSILLTITPENDPPVIDLIPRFEVTENQFLKLDFADYVTDVDDTTLTVRVSALTNNNKMALAATNVGATTVGDSLQYLITDFGDTVIFTPEIEWSDTSLIQLSVIDGQSARASKTFVIDIIRVSRPNLSLEVIQNNAFTNFFEVVITDTILKTDSLFLTVQGQRIPLDTVAAYTYVGHYSFDNSGTYSFYAKAWGVVGDTTITRSVFMAQAKAHYDWTGFSPDGNFRVFGTSGAVPYDQGLLIVDSTMFNEHFNDRAPYRLGRESKRFEIPVEVSFLSTNDIFAIYQRVNGVEWVELPSITKEGQIVAYTEGMGYFRLGPKTIIVPGETSLRQNYPNPFNPVTNIIYDVGFNEGPRQKVNVIVYNLLGQHVATLVNEYKNIGRYTTRWDGKDQHGVPVSSGIYFVRLMNDHGRIYTKKMMLIR